MRKNRKTRRPKSDDKRRKDNTLKRLDRQRGKYRGKPYEDE